MAWFGEIKSLRNKDDIWVLVVDYFDDSNPTKRIQRTITLPLNTTKAQAVVRIRQVGAEVRAVSVLNADNIVGTVISIP